MKFEFKSSDISKNMKDFMERSDRAERIALGRVGLAINQDTIQEEPKPPFDTGYLRGSQFMYVMGKKAELGNAIQGTVPATVPVQPNTLTVEVGLNTPYAKYQHENLGKSIFPARFFSRSGQPKDTAGVGGKFLEAKLARFKDDYAKLFAETYKKEAGL